jgi:type IV pilus assembly protein PilW
MTTARLHRPVPRRQPRGFTLIELLVAVAVGMALTLVLTTMMIRFESGKRTLTSSNDLALNSSFVAYTLDRELRSAGSGFTQSWRETFGCTLRVARGGAQILPRAAAFPAPFAAIPQQVRLMPVLIHAGAGADGSDVLAIATGSSGMGETPYRVQPTSATTNQVRVTSTIGLRGNDLVVVAEPASDCMVQQVAAPFAGGATQELNFAGNYADDDIGGVALASYATVGTAQVSLLGNVAGNRPMFQLFGVGANATLFSYDLLRLDGNDAAQPLADGVADMRALYGIDNSVPSDGRIDAWVAPTAAGYTVAELTDGSALAQTRLLTILAVRVGMVLRSDRIEREEVSPASLTLFSDLPALAFPRGIPVDERRQRFRTVEFTVPLRNVILAS